MVGCYILDDNREPVLCEDPVEFAEFMGDMSMSGPDKLRVGLTTLEEGTESVTISTVFLGLDHSFGTGPPPILFETMVFDGEHNGYQRRYSNWHDAEEGHAQTVAMVVASVVDAQCLHRMKLPNGSEIEGDSE